MSLRRATTVVFCSATAAIGVLGMWVSTSAGQPRAGASIIGGTPANPNAWGFTVGILDRGRFICSGSVIAPTKILTAAHCAVDTSPSRLTVVAGRQSLTNGTQGEVINVGSVSVHPDYGSVLHDLAVLTLTRPTSVPPIALAAPGEDAAVSTAGTILQVAGFGDRNPTIFGKRHAGVLEATNERVRSNCLRDIGAGFSSDAMVCTLGRRIGRLPVHRGTCYGDSGGPLVEQTTSGPRLVGVTSQGRPFGVLVCGAKTYDVFARVSSDLGFIRAAIGAGSPPKQLVSFLGSPNLRVKRQISFPFVCTADCDVTLTMTLALAGPNVGPITAQGHLAGGQVGIAYLTLNRPALIRAFRVGGALAARADVVLTSVGDSDSHSRIFGLR
jgi:secreted trypsin-like serine protease